MRGRYRLTRRGCIVLFCLMLILLGILMLLIRFQQDRQIARQNEVYRALKPSAVATPRTTPVPTPNDGTVRITLPTEPPRDAAYDMLTAINADFCGWLTAGAVDLPVVHRLNDNEAYLATSFSGEDSVGGTLFVDGFNRLYPADMLTVIYGHNMNSGDMFGSLSDFFSPDYLSQHPIVQFDTLYAPGRYVPFAIFTAPADEVDIRQFQMSVDSFNALTDLCLSRSAYDMGIDVRYGDKLLALVTCDGRGDDRLFLLCRALRPGESEMDIVMKLDSLSK